MVNSISDKNIKKTFKKSVFDINGKININCQSGKRDSNPRHLAWEANTLPTELFPLSYYKYITKIKNFFM